MSAVSMGQLVGKRLTLVKACARVYKNDDCVLPHTDEKGLDHSLSVFLGGEYTHLWPLWVQKPEVHKTPQMCALAEGDAVLYRGSEVHHWRDHFEGVSWCQLLVHYAEVSEDGPSETERAGEESL